MKKSLNDGNHQDWNPPYIGPVWFKPPQTDTANRPQRNTTCRTKSFRPGKNTVRLVTFWLADAMPRILQQKLMLTGTNPDSFRQRSLYYRRLERGLAASQGCCSFLYMALSIPLQFELLEYNSQRYHLLEWSIMPNHIHVLLEPLGPMADIVLSLKKSSIDWLRLYNGEIPIHTPEPVFWSDGWHEYPIGGARHLQAVINKIHQDPVRAGLCTTPEEWRFSSACYYHEKQDIQANTFGF